MVARNFSNTAVETTLQSGIDDVETSLVVGDATGYPTAPFTIIIEAEVILVGGKAGTTFNTLTRGFGGTTAISHSAGAIVQHVAVAADIAKITDHVHVPATDDTQQVDHGGLGGLADDDHTQYHTDGRADAWIGTKDTDDLAEGVVNEYFKVHDHTEAAEGGTLLSLFTGVMFPFGGASGAVPAWALLCNGAAVSRTTYAALFAKIGTVFGVGDGSTTFNLPDMRGKFPLGVAASGTGDALGETGGAIDHTHTQPTHTHTQPTHNHVASVSGDTGGAKSDTTGIGFQTGTTDHDHAFNDANATSSSGGDTTGASGADATGLNNPPFVALNFIIGI